MCLEILEGCQKKVLSSVPNILNLISNLYKEKYVVMGRIVMNSFDFMFKQTLRLSNSCVNACTAYHIHICVIICA